MGVAGLSGCAGILGGGDDVRDTDGDGVIDSEDYAPRDPDVQERSDLVDESTEGACECPTETDRPTGGERVIDDFEDGTVTDWGVWEDRERLDVTTDAVRGDYAAVAPFQTHAYLRFDATTASELRFWWKSEAVSDNELTISFHESAENEWPSRDTAGFGMEVGAENDSQVVATPPFQNTTSSVPIYDQPEADTWYQTRFSSVDFEANVCDVALYDRSGTKLGEVTEHPFESDISSVTHLRIKNRMNFTESSGYIDHVVATDDTGFVGD